MRRDKYEDERGSGGNGGSSWISYSDMMASLMLVFVLMLCVSLLKYFTAPKEEDLQLHQKLEEQLKEIELREADLAEREEKLAKALADLEKDRAELEKDRAELQQAQEQLAKDRAELQKAQEQLEKDRAELQAAQEQLEKDRTELKKAQEQLAKDRAELQKAQEQLKKDQVELQTAKEQLTKDRAELQAAQEQLEKDRTEQQAAQEQLAKDRAELQKAQEQLEKDRAELQKAQEQLAQEQLAKDQAELRKAQEQLAKDQAELLKAQEQLRLEQEAFRAEKEAEVTPTPEPESEWQREVQREIEKQQAILDQYSLRSRIIASQYSAFENSNLNITINQDTGDITMPNFILFEPGSSELSDEGKQFLDTFIPQYLEVLMRPEFESDISEVVIEGHTDSSFSTDMELSQQRALRVMTYSMQMPTLTEAQRAYLADRATFIGRGFTDPVFDENGQINRDASRRVEIKFQIRDNHLLAESDLVGELTGRLNEAGIPASVNPETGDVLPSDILFFEPGEDKLTREGKLFIRKFLPVYLDVMMKRVYRKQVGMLIFEGTADQLVPDADRLELSQRRAAHLMEYCMRMNLTEAQLTYLQKTLATAGRMENNAGAQVTFRFRLKNANSLTELRNLLQDS